MIEWRDIPGFEDLYQVSSHGQVKSCEKTIVIGNYRTERPLRERIMRPFMSNGYLCVFLKRNGERRKYSVHRLVACVFIPNPENLLIVNHKHGDKRDNRATELEWMSASGNTNHYYKGRAMAEAHNEAF